MNLGDWATERPYKDYLPYLVAKGGLTTMTLALARELAPHIPVAMIQPAMIDPPPDFTESEKQAVIEQTPLRRVGSSKDVNRLILYLLDGTNFVTGSCFRVDGGRFLGPSRVSAAKWALSETSHPALRMRRTECHSVPRQRRATCHELASMQVRSERRNHRQDDLRRVGCILVDCVVGRDHSAIVAQRDRRCWGSRRIGDNCCSRHQRECGGLS